VSRRGTSLAHTRGENPLDTMRLHIVSALAILGTALVAVPASAETVINNQISVSANSGGNSASSGQVIEGHSQSQVVIKSEINGEVIVDEVKVVTSTGKPAVLKESKEIVSSSYRVKTEIEVGVNVSSTVKPELETAQENLATTTTKSQAFVERLWRTIINTFSYYANWLWK